jgi:drug/metabolite transporter (DMT)-like permease
VLLIASGEPMPGAAALAWGGLAGACGVGGLGAFYLALSRGTMGLIAPLAALIGAAVPALVAIIAGAEVGPTRLAGIVVAMAAVVLISLPTGERTAHDRRALRIGIADLPLVIVAGLGFAGFYLGLDRAAAAGGQTWWPILLVRAVGLLLVLAVAAALLARASGPLRQRAAGVLGLPRLRAYGLPLAGIVPLFLLAGAGDLGGNAFFVLANAADTLPVAVVLSSLYPATTTIMAAVFLHERLRPLQVAAIGMAIFGVALIGLGGVA